MTEQPSSSSGGPHSSEDELVRSNFQLRTLYDVGQVIGSLRDPQEIVRELLLMAIGTFGMRRGFVFVIDMETDRCEAVFHRGLSKEHALTLERRSAEGALRGLTTEGGSEVLEGPPASPGSLREALVGAGIEIWAPFLVTKRLAGGIGLGGSLSGEPFGPGDREFLVTLANQLTIALDNAFAYRVIEELNQGLEIKVQLRTEELQRKHGELVELNEQLELRNGFIRSVFGKYVSDEVVTNLLESPEGLELGGAKRKVAILMSDLRGFTSLAEKLNPEQVVSMINRYLSVMVDVILTYKGTIQEFVGDEIVVLFGAFSPQADDAERAVACSIAMQLAMGEVNEHNRQDGLPEVAMGIGVHTGVVVVGNIGSVRRAKYGVIGSPVNLTSRIESYATGGQILVSSSVHEELEELIDSAPPFEVEAKGIGKPFSLHDVRGIRGTHRLSLPTSNETPVELTEPIPVRFTVLASKHLVGQPREGSLVTLSVDGCEMRSEHAPVPLADIRLQILDQAGRVAFDDLYAKVIAQPTDRETNRTLRFTFVPPRAASHLRELRNATGAAPRRSPGE
jgi:class 3 adenylate cyclase